MKRDFLKNLGIEDKEVIDKIMSEYGNRVEKYKTDIEDLKEEIADKQSAIDKNREIDIEGIQKSNADLQKELETAQNTIKEMTNNRLIEQKLAEYYVQDIETIEKLLNKETLKIEDNKIEGLDEQMEDLKKSKPFLFKKKEALDTHNLGGSSGKPNADEEVNSIRDALALQLKDN